MDLPQIREPHLRLIAHAPAHFLALIEGPASYQSAIGLPPAEELRDFIVSKDVSAEWLAALRQNQVYDPWTHGFGVVHIPSHSVIGCAGFKGPPGADGIVEIAYGIVPAFQGRGFATAAAQALVTYASASELVRLIRAHTLPQSNASTRVLTKCGFGHVGEVVDPEDGLVWRWERNPATP